jgi:ATP-binding cassette subfamily F protein 3
VLLARLILQAPDLLLLDEPTNHLDVSAVEWLEATLKDYDGSIVAVAHDRYFLDAAVEHVWELDQGRLETYTGNYSKYLMLRAERYEQRLKEYERQREFIEKEQDYIRRNMAGQNTRQAKGRLKRLERLSDDPDAKFKLARKPKQRKSVRLNLGSRMRSGDIVLRAHDLIVGYQDDRKPLVRVGQLELFRGQRVALWGPNGVGKTTFLKTVLAEIPPLEGEVELGASVNVGYFSQTQDALDPDQSILDTLLAAEHMPISQARNYLGRYLFSGDDAFKPVGTLSGGERARVALALLSLRGANVLLLDEPTNHLDLGAQEVLQDVLLDFEGTMILVSHDRYLVNALATHVWAVEDTELRVYEGNYNDYVAQRAIERERQKSIEAREREASQSKTRPDKAAQLEARRREKRIAELESEIDALETRLNDLSRQIEMATPDSVASLGQEYAQVEQELQELVNEWSRVVEM